jgi:hypothetical protein
MKYRSQNKCAGKVAARSVRIYKACPAFGAGRWKCRFPRPKDAGRSGAVKLAAALALAVLLQACASPVERLLRRGDELGFSRQTLSAQGFQMASFYKTGLASSKVLHVYLEGDGLLWVSPTQTSADPTPGRALMLELMRRDSSPSLYLGRPCYNGHAQDPGCSPLLWTDRRYAPEIVQAMAEALAVFLRKNPFSGLVFIGHSGGGAIALLLAQRFPSTLVTLTVAGNADIDLWAIYHGYSPLEGSLNPADFADGTAAEIHLLGGKDPIIPPALFIPALQKRRNARIEIVEIFDHVCCWESLWPKILADVP